MEDLRIKGNSCFFSFFFFSLIRERIRKLERGRKEGFSWYIVVWKERNVFFIDADRKRRIVFPGIDIRSFNTRMYCNFERS